MDRVKIQEIAVEAGASNAVLIEKAKELGYDVKVANSTVTIEQASALVDYVINGVKPIKEAKSLLKSKKRGSITAIPKKKKVEETLKDSKYWLIPSNPEDFDAIEELKKGTVWWSNKLNNMQVNDIVYVYISKPVQKISIKSKIVDIDEDKKIFCLELIEFLTSDKLSYSNLLKNGLTNIQGKHEIKNLSLLQYIQEHENLNKKKESRIANNDREQKFSDDKIDYNFSYKNILLKGVPGTGKSRTLDNIITNHLKLKEEHQETNVLRINIHSASSNADLMQGIGISSNDNGNIEYKEKQGLILEHIEKATFMPNQPFVLVLEEIQENSLNELIGDLIYLIEKDKRANGYLADNEKHTYTDLIDNIMTQNKSIKSVKLPSLISQEQKSKRMIIPENLFIFCTSNYRDDRKVIEDNLLRRFEVIEIYPKYDKKIFKSLDIAKFLKELNESIVKVCRNNGEIHPDRFMIGHSIWLDIEQDDIKAFVRAFLKVLTEFKDVKDMHFDDFLKITKEIQFPFGLDERMEDNHTYEDWINNYQNYCYDFLK